MRIVVLDGATLNPGDNSWEAVQQNGELTVYPQTEAEQLVERAAGAEVLIINKVQLAAPELDQLDRLRMVAITATGFDCVDVQHARTRDIPVCNVPIYGTDSVAQHVFAMLLHVIHRVDVHDQAIRKGDWQACGNFSFWLSPLFELSGKTMGVVGFGRIGRSVAKLAAAFGMNVAACSRTKPSTLPPGVTWMTLDELLASSDVVSLHCPLTSETKGLIDRERLQLFKPNAILINASRGPLIVESDLADALSAGQLAAAALDVVCQEPIDDGNPLLGATNCFLTPHMAWATLEARQRLMAVTAENIQAFRRGTPQNLVN